MVDTKELQAQVETVIKYSQDYPFAVHAGQLIEDWYNAKKYYIDLFDGELIKKYKYVSYTLSEKEKEEQFQSFLEYCAVEDWFDEDDEGLEAFRDFLIENQEGFFNNKVAKSDNSYGIQRGMKLSKCFKYFISDHWKLRQAQDAASRVMQADKCDGWIYLSVHPLDYLTIGETNHKWRSCHALDGDYRSGNASYMVDDTTIIAYLASDKQEQLKCMPSGMLWNSKKWRMLVHTNQFKSIIYYDRQYPFTNGELLGDVHDMIKSLPVCGGQASFSTPHDVGVREVLLGGFRKWALPENYILNTNDDLVKVSDIIDYSDYTGYPDLKTSPHYTPVVSYRDTSTYWTLTKYGHTRDKEYQKIFHKTFDLKIGGKYNCLKCGEETVKDKKSFLCLTCIANEDLDEDTFLVCACCGSRIYDIDDDAYEVDGEYYCTGCYMNMEDSEEECPEESVGAMKEDIRTMLDRIMTQYREVNNNAKEG